MSVSAVMGRKKEDSPEHFNLAGCCPEKVTRCCKSLRPTTREGERSHKENRKENPKVGIHVTKASSEFELCPSLSLVFTQQKKSQGAETCSVSATSPQESWYHKKTTTDVSMKLGHSTGGPKLRQ